VHYLFDHDAEEALFADLLLLLRSFSSSAAVAKELRRAAASLRYHAILHVKKEEEIVVPLVMKHFTSDEQKSMIQSAVGGYTPEQLMKTFPWIVKAQTPEDRVTFIFDDLMSLMPPDVFGAVTGWIREGIPTDDWQDIVRRAPQLVQKGARP
jgi:hypothetical protein